MTTRYSARFFSGLKLAIAIILLDSCVERVDFDSPAPRTLMVVDGFISTDPPPYKISVTRGFRLDADSIEFTPIEKLNIVLFEVNGDHENLSEISPGVYETGGSIRGQVGRSYYIQIETADGKIFESQPDRISPVGSVKEIRYMYEKRIIQKNFYEVDNDVFNIFIDADAGEGADIYVRWRFKGTYLVVSYPELFMRSTPPYTPYKDPFPCSGYILTPGPMGSGGLLVKMGDCTCCTCWANNFETIPKIAETGLVSGNGFKNVKVGEVPINNSTFYDKYLVEVEQMSLTKSSYDFFKLVRKQKEEGASLFQPPPAEIRGNIKPLNNNDLVIGLFWATSVTEKHLFIDKSDIPYPLPKANLNTLPCTTVPYSSTIKPKLWQ